jgi:hypothetical protein
LENQFPILSTSALQPDLKKKKKKIKIKICSHSFLHFSFALFYFLPTHSLGYFCKHFLLNLFHLTQSHLDLCHPHISYWPSHLAVSALAQCQPLFPVLSTGHHLLQLEKKKKMERKENEMKEKTLLWLLPNTPCRACLVLFSTYIYIYK